MALQDVVRSKMMQAMKDKDTVTKNALSALLAALKAKTIDKRSDLTDEESLAVVMHEVKQLKETVATAPAGYDEIVNDAKAKIEVLSQFLPEQMSEDEIKKTIEKVLESLSLTAPTAKEKGIIMKSLMPLTKGKADGKLVNEILSGYFS